MKTNTEPQKGIPLATGGQIGERARSCLDRFATDFKLTPNLLRVLAHSGAALEGFTELMRANLSSSLGSKAAEQFMAALAVHNGSDYAFAAHSALAANFGVSKEDVIAARNASATDPKTAAGLRFALRLLDTHGRVSDSELAAVREAGYSDEELVEIAALIGQSVITAIVNNLAKTPVDFPAPPRK